MLNAEDFAARELPCSRKPSEWDDVTATVSSLLLPEGVREFEPHEVWDARRARLFTPQPHEGFDRDMPFLFIVWIEGVRYLVRTEGYSYCRYVTRIEESASLEATFEAIAQRHLRIETLKARGRDDLDFHDCSVVTIRAALLEAYEAGLKANR